MTDREKELTSLCILLAGLYNEAEKVRGQLYSSGCNKVQGIVEDWPMVQGTANQIHLEKIGKGEYNPESIKRAVNFLLDLVDAKL